MENKENAYTPQRNETDCNANALQKTIPPNIRFRVLLLR